MLVAWLGCGGRARKVVTVPQEKVAPVATPVAAAADADGEFPALLGTRWDYRGSVKWVDASHRVQEKTVAWTMAITRVVDRDGWRAIVVLGHPDDLVRYDPGAKATERVLIRDPGGTVTMTPKVDETLAAFAAGGALEGIARGGFVIRVPVQLGQRECDDPDADPDESRWCWIVEESRPWRPTLAELPKAGGVEYQLIYRTNPDHIVWSFVPGLGITAYSYAPWDDQRSRPDADVVRAGRQAGLNIRESPPRGDIQSLCCHGCYPL